MPDKKENAFLSVSESSGDDVKTGGKNLFVKIVASALALAILGLIIYTLLPGRQAEKVIEKFMTALKDNDPSVLEGLYSPATLEYGGFDRSERTELFAKGLASLRSPVVSQFGEGFTLTWRIIHEDPVDRADLIEVNSKLEAKGIDPIAEEKYLNVELTLEGNGADHKEEMRFLMSKEGKHWYIVSFAN